MSILESDAQFQARAEELKLPDECLKSLTDQGATTLGNLAFVLGTTPGDTRPEDFERFSARLVATESDKLVLKRLIFEAQTLFVASLKQQVEGTSSSGSTGDQPQKKLPPIERQSRIDEQKKRLTGLLIQGDHEPSHELIDLVHSIGKPEPYATSHHIDVQKENKS